MAYIDKMHFDKRDIPEFYRYMKSVDGEFRKFFPNAGSILDYTCFDSQGTPDKLSEWESGEDLPVSNFPEIVDRWLARREDLPEMIRKQLEFQYGELRISKGDNSIFTSPVFFKDPAERSTRFRIVKWSRIDGRKIAKAYSKWAVDIRTDYWRYYEDLDLFVRSGFESPELLGFDCESGSCCCLSRNFRSVKSVFRFLRKHGFPKGTVIRIFDFRYYSSEIEIEFI